MAHPQDRASHYLPWGKQVAELEKIRALCLSEFTTQPTLRDARLVGPVPGSERPCVVCGAASARRCSACAGVSYCSDEHFRKDFPWHARVCTSLREIAEDRAVLATWTPEDLAAELVLLRSSSRADTELSSLDDYLRDFAGRAPACRRVVGALASRPLTLAHALSHLGRAPKRGLLRVHVLAAAQRELRDPAWVYEDALSRWREARFEIDFFGPELPLDHDLKPRRAGAVTCRFHRSEYRRALWQTAGVPDLVIWFNCGLFLYPSWRSTLLDLRGHDVPFVLTSYRAWEQVAEAQLLASVGARIVMTSRPNPFASPSADRSTTLVNDVSYDNAHIMAVTFPSA